MVTFAIIYLICFVSLLILFFKRASNINKEDLWSLMSFKTNTSMKDKYGMSHLKKIKSLYLMLVVLAATFPLAIVLYSLLFEKIPSL